MDRYLNTFTTEIENFPTRREVRLSDETDMQEHTAKVIGERWRDRQYATHGFENW